MVDAPDILKPTDGDSPEVAGEQLSQGMTQVILKRDMYKYRASISNLDNINIKFDFAMKHFGLDIGLPGQFELVQFSN